MVLDEEAVLGQVANQGMITLEGKRGLEGWPAAFQQQAYVAQTPGPLVQGTRTRLVQGPE